MRTVEQEEQHKLSIKEENIIHFPLGILGFEQVKKFVLLTNPEEDPFMWLQMLDNPNQGFFVVSPAAVLPDYTPDVGDPDIEVLGIQSAAEAIVLCIVTVSPNGSATVNLKGPIIINRQRLIGKQVIPTNAANYSLQHPVSTLCVAA